MLCATLTKEIGFACDSVKTVTGVDAFRITTPVDFIDGSPFSFYVFEEDGRITATDNGNTLFHLFSRGILESDTSRQLIGISNLTDRFCLSLSDSGEIRTEAAIHQRSEVMNLFLEFAYSLKTWETERITQTSCQAKLLDEVEEALKLWKPNMKLEKAPSIMGASGKKYQFDFALGDQLIDAITPDSRTTGSRLRKIFDIARENDDADILIVIDNREDAKSAQIERAILSEAAQVINFTDLAHAA